MSLIEILLEFWFKEAGPDRWFARSQEFDDLVLRRFLKLHEQAATGRLYDWEETAEGALALCLLLDQFPRNMFRGTPRAFETDNEALGVAAGAIAHGFDRADSMTDQHRLFFYLPFEHSESLENQDHACRLIGTLSTNPDLLKWAEEHRAIVKRFGRFPHRNDQLGRISTPEEEAFLKTEEGRKLSS